MKPKSSFEIDGIPFKILKYVPEHIIDILTYKFYLSLSSGLFIESFKTFKFIFKFFLSLKRVVFQILETIDLLVFYHHFLRFLKK